MRPESVFVFDRSEWIDANISNFQVMFEPVERINRRAMAHGTLGTVALGNVNRLVLSNQLGLLLGVLARRVLDNTTSRSLGKSQSRPAGCTLSSPTSPRLLAGSAWTAKKCGCGLLSTKRPTRSSSSATLGSASI